VKLLSLFIGESDLQRSRTNTRFRSKAMVSKSKLSDAVTILHRRYVKDDPRRKASLQAERLNAEVAALLHELRTRAGLSQTALARMVGTTQSVISRLEDADYEGHSLTMLSRIASALNQKLTVAMTPHR
jgi:ribosome-binding protein aMBF1 (putative translation factor)